MKIETKYNINEHVSFKVGEKTVDGNVIEINIKEYFNIFTFDRGSNITYVVCERHSQACYTLEENEIKKYI